MQPLGIEPSGGFRKMSTTHRLTRRKALHVLGSTVAVGGILGAIGCSKAAEPPPPAPTSAAPPPPPPKPEAACPGDIDDASKQMRRNLQYKDKTAEAGKNCAGCVQWVPPAAGATCGGCNLFTGPVHPEGHCLSFAPKA